MILMPPRIARLRMLEIMSIDGHEEDEELVSEFKELTNIVWNSELIYTLTYPDGRKLHTFDRQDIADVLGVGQIHVRKLMGLGKIDHGKCRGYTITRGEYR